MAQPTAVTTVQIDDGAVDLFSNGVSLVGGYSVQSIQDTIKLGPGKFGATTYTDGLVGVAFISDNGSASRTGVQFFNRTDETSASAAGLDIDIAHSGTTPYQCRICPLPNKEPGYSYAAYYGTGGISYGFVRPGFAGLAATKGGTQTLCLAPMSRTKFSTTALGVKSTSGNQMYIGTLRVDHEQGGSSAGSLASMFEKEYNNASSTSWGSEWSATSNRPTGILQIQQLPRTGASSAQASNGVILLGVHASDAVGDYLTIPACATVENLSEGGTGGGVLLSHAPNATYRAHGMVVDQEGYIYTVGTGDFIGNAANKLICKYPSWDYTSLQAHVLHGADFDVGANFGYDQSQTAANSKIINPIWTGSHLIVFDVDSAKTRAFVFKKDLTYVTKFDVKSSGSSHARAWGGRYTTPFWRDNY